MRPIIKIIKGLCGRQILMGAFSVKSVSNTIREKEQDCLVGKKTLGEAYSSQKFNYTEEWSID